MQHQMMKENTQVEVVILYSAKKNPLVAEILLVQRIAFTRQIFFND
jgi:hypothetical protein